MNTNKKVSGNSPLSSDATETRKKRWPVNEKIHRIVEILKFSEDKELWKFCILVIKKKAGCTEC